MTSRVATFAIDAIQPRVVADFWLAAPGWQEVEDDGEVITGCISTGPAPL